LNKVIYTLLAYDPDRCPRDAKADLYFRTDRHAVSMIFKSCDNRRRNLRTVIAARVELDTPADDNAGSGKMAYHKLSHYLSVAGAWI
jgi:hypothetical protein